MEDVSLTGHDKKRQLLPLTSLRFVAASMIVLHHGIDRSRLPFSFPLDHGVSFFFVLSGFILAYNYQLRNWPDARRFLILRVARIWPAHIVTTIAAVFILHTFNFKIIANVLMIQSWVPIASWYFSYNAVSWSISTEFFFYVAFVFMSFRWQTTFWWKLIGCVALLWLLMAVGSSLKLPAFTPDTVSLHGLLYVGPLARLLEFVSGMSTFLLYRWLLPRADRVHAGIFTILELSALAFSGYIMSTGLFLAPLLSILPPTAGQYLGHAYSWPAFVPVILVFAFQKGYVSKLLSFKIPVLLGETSYSLYLVHQLVFGVIAHRLRVTGWSAFVIGAAASQVIAFALWAYIENPARYYVKRALARRKTEPVLYQASFGRSS